MAEKVLMKGNEAIAEAAIIAGCKHYFGYPITPQTEIAAYMAKRMPKIIISLFNATRKSPKASIILLFSLLSLLFGFSDSPCRSTMQKYRDL